MVQLMEESKNILHAPGQPEFLQVMEWYSKSGLSTAIIGDCMPGKREFPESGIGGEYGE